MRRLIRWIYLTVFGLRIHSHTQHIADLLQLLTDHLDLRRRNNAEIARITTELLEAYRKQDAALKAKHEYIDACADFGTQQNFDQWFDAKEVKP